MNPKLEAKYLFLEKSRNKLLDELEGLDDVLLNTCPAEGKWSIGQIVAHLLIVEQRTVGYIRHKIAKDEELSSSSVKNMINSILLKLALSSGMKFKAPQVIASVPDEVSLTSIRTEWDEARYEMEDMLTELSPALLDKCLFRHPYAGMLSISQTLSFLQDHFNHHLQQIHHLKQQLTKQA